MKMQKKYEELIEQKKEEGALRISYSVAYLPSVWFSSYVFLE